MDYEHLRLDHRGDALWVTMDRPERLNALNRRIVEELGLQIATPDEARGILGLKGADRVKF